ncbi:MAG: hypothetical protein KY434_09385, partial [Actinobacteria bacterium]|nr:hypothetical protein [Actinomycetota bacterium]
RYVESSLAYQGHARGLGVGEVGSVNRWAVEGHLADVVVLLALDPGEGLRRVQARARSVQADAARRRPGEGGLFELPRSGAGAGTDRIEREGLDFHRRVARGYLDLARHDDGRFLVVDASGDPQDIASQVRAGLHRWVPLPERPDDEEGRDLSGVIAELFPGTSTGDADSG